MAIVDHRGHRRGPWLKRRPLHYKIITSDAVLSLIKALIAKALQLSF